MWKGTKKEISEALGRRYIVFDGTGREMAVQFRVLRDAVRCADENGGGEVWISGRRVYWPERPMGRWYQ